jgi:2-hydroxycyclohexanecarboxyl-CoA dehydrogenase
MTERSRVAAVTGGASGIGEACCRHLAAAGHRVAVLDLDAGKAERVAKDLEAAGHTAVAVAVDVADRDAVHRAFDEVRAALGPTEILVTSAGLCLFTPLEDIRPDDFHRTMDVNLGGTLYAVQAVIPEMVEAGWGRIITISSSSGQRGAVRAPAYAAAKAGVIMLTKSLALTYARHGITINTIPPSGIETPMQHQGQADGHLPSNEVMAKAVPVGRLGGPDDIAAAATFLASEAAAFITAQTFGVNGGQVL